MRMEGVGHVLLPPLWGTVNLKAPITTLGWGLLMEVSIR